MHYPVELSDGNWKNSTSAMIDSGATALFLSHQFAEKHHLERHKLDVEILVQNIDGTLNCRRPITHDTKLKLKMEGGKPEDQEFLITDIGPEDIILGLPWLRHHNSNIDWKKGTLKFDEAPPTEQLKMNCKGQRKWVWAGLISHAPEEVWIAAGYTYSQAIAEKTGKEKKKRSFEEIVPEEYREYAKVFSEQESEQLPKHQPWDHTIDLKPDAPESFRSKVYPMPVNEQKELDDLLEKNVWKKYIAPSKSPMASPVFFIKKKDAKLWLIQDYRKLNRITIKNRYLLPLASDIVNTLRRAKYFTKFDVRWGYNVIERLKTLFIFPFSFYLSSFSFILSHTKHKHRHRAYYKAYSIYESYKTAS